MLAPSLALFFFSCLGDVPMRFFFFARFSSPFFFSFSPFYFPFLLFFLLHEEVAWSSVAKREKNMLVACCYLCADRALFLSRARFSHLTNTCSLFFFPFTKRLSSVFRDFHEHARPFAPFGFLRPFARSSEYIFFHILASACLSKSFRFFFLSGQRSNFILFFFFSFCPR